VNPPSHIESEIKDALSRARKAGAEGALAYVGAGAYGIVFCDDAGRAWKVFRKPRESGNHVRSGHEIFLRESLQTEFEWLDSASESSMAENVVRVYSMDLEHLVLCRDCVEGEPGGWKDESRLHEIHKKLAAAMEPLGWSAPEFKADSYVITPDGQAVLVDASMAMRIGQRLLCFVKDVIDGERESYETPSTLAFFVLREVRHGLPKADADPVIQDLVKLDPQIKENFSLSGSMVRERGLSVKGRRYQVDISKNRATADVKDASGRPLTSLNLGDMEDLLSIASYIRSGRYWEKAGRFIGDNDRSGYVVVDTKHGVRMKGMTAEDVAELVLISEEAVLAMV
jgi:hypothetical protein